MSHWQEWNEPAPRCSCEAYGGLAGHTSPTSAPACSKRRREDGDCGLNAKRPRGDALAHREALCDGVLHFAGLTVEEKDHDVRQDGDDFDGSSVGLFVAPDEEIYPVSAASHSMDMVDSDEEACSVVVSGFPRGRTLERLRDYFASNAVLRREPVIRDDGTIHITFRNRTDVHFTIEWFKNPAKAMIDSHLVSVSALKASL